MNEADSGLVSTIIPVYNRPDMLSESVASVLAQTYRPIEIIIIDDGSTDNTAEVGKRLAQEHPDEIVFVSIANGGPGRARETGRGMAKGEFIQYLDSDDLLLPRKFELQVAGLLESTECDISYGKTREFTIGEKPIDIATRRTGEKHIELFPATLDGRLWATETPLFRWSAIDKIGSWSDMRVLEDWEYECRLGALRVRLHYCDEYVSEHRHHTGSREGLGWQDDTAIFKDMLNAHVKVLDYAKTARVELDSPEMKRYARNLFRLARDAGARGLDKDAGQLLELARDIDLGRSTEYLLYRKCAEMIGWRRLSTLSERVANWVRR